MKLSNILAHLAWLLLAIPGWAGPFFKIDYTGVVTGGSVTGVTDTQDFFTLDLPLGTTVSGTMIFDIGLAPAAVVSPGTFTETAFDDLSPGIAWIGGSFSLELPDLPPDALPIPSAFSLTRSLRPPDAVDFLSPSAQQSLAISYGTSCCATVIGIADFTDAWSTSNLVIQEREFVGLLISSVDSFLPQTPGAPSSFVGTNLQGGSSFGFLRFSRDPTNLTPPLFGITGNYVVGGTFDVTSATGQLLETLDAPVPEPSTWLAVLAGLAVVWMRRPR